MVKMNESAANIKFMECRMKGRKEKFVMQMEYPQCLFQVHEFESTQHYLDTLHKNKSLVHNQVGCRNMALTFNGCMMFYEFGQDDASEKAKQLIDTLKEAAKWYDEFLKDNQAESTTQSDGVKGEISRMYFDEFIPATHTDAQTPSDWMKSAAYGDAEKSQNIIK